ncbi:hypothetical protein FKM82_004818 [Ascaphus truei]
MDLRPSLLLLLWTSLTVLSLLIREMNGHQVYTNTWAVHIPEGLSEADRIAKKHGFINHGQVQHGRGKTYLNHINRLSCII